MAVALIPNPPLPLTGEGASPRQEPGGVRDPHNRSITVLRVSVTDRCNLACTYCRPHNWAPTRAGSRLLSFEQIVSVARECGLLGFRKIRFTGGEPLARRQIERVVGMTADLALFEDIAMTTNGLLLTPSKARTLKNAGLRRVNISIDSLNPVVYSRITRGGTLQSAIRGVEAALQAGLSPVKINMVLFSETTEEEILNMRFFCEVRGLTLQLIRRFSLSLGRGSGAADGVAHRPGSCSDCDRLRLTADGHLKPCLFSDHEIKIDFHNIRGSILRAIAVKPEAGAACFNRAMNEIGG